MAGGQTPLLLADLTGKGRASIVAFGDAGVWTAVGDGTAQFPAPISFRLILATERLCWR